MNAIEINPQARPCDEPDLLLIGIGNSSRRDDGLGWAFLEAVEQLPSFQGRAEYRYQLQVEDAALIAEYPTVVFVDAFQGKLPGGFRWQACAPAPAFEFTTHALPPEAILFLCEELYGRQPAAYTLALEGLEWGLREGLSARAVEHLQAGLVHFQEQLRHLAMRKANPIDTIQT
jgi:hydrogenase maturation protease